MKNRKLTKWDKFQNFIVNKSLNAYKEDLSELKLIAAVIRQHAEDKDLEYFCSTAFKEHCWLMRLKFNVVYYTIKKIWER